MANKTIPELTAVTTLSASDIMVVDTGIQTFKITVANMVKAMTPLMLGLPPVGAIMPYLPGNFTNGSNAGFAIVGPAGNTEAQVDTYLASGPWRLCRGLAPNDADSPLYNTAGKFMPNISGQRFLRGNTTCGSVGGAASVTLTTTELPSHDHGPGTFAASLGLSGSAPSLSGNTGLPSGSHVHGPGANMIAQITYNASGLFQRNRSGPASWTSDNIKNVAGSVTGGSSGITDGACVEGNTAGPSATTSVTISNGSYSLTGSNAITGTSGTRGSGSAFSIIPLYLDCFYIQRIKQ